MWGDPAMEQTTEARSCRPRVLVVEPDPSTREAAVRLLESAGYDVTAAATVEAAVTASFWSASAAPPPPVWSTAGDEATNQ